MRQYKSTTFISELQKYFSSDEKTIQTLFTELRSLKFLNRIFQVFDKKNTQYLNYHRFIMLILFPFFEIKDISHFTQSALYQTFKSGKDVFYRFLNDKNINWRKIAYKVNFQLINRVKKHSYNSDNDNVRCLIADDTDLPKSGRKFEFLSRIFSHVSHSQQYGFKGLFLGYQDGKSFFGLDFSLHGEKGKDEKKPYGLTKKQSKKRLQNKNRNKKSCSQNRVNEYFKSKTEMLTEMIRRAILNEIRFDYLLTDSWFTNFELLKFITTRRIRCHFLGMVKRGNTKYLFKNKELTFNEILKVLKHSKKMIYDKKTNCYFYEVEVEIKGLKIKLFFSRIGKRGNWHGLLTTNRKLTFRKAFEIYSTRWTIEVFFKECKQYLRLGKCESRHFEAQIAATTLCMLQYNLLSVLKRFECYETFGALFRNTKTEILELTVKERIWLIIIELLTGISEFMSFELDILLNHIIADNQRITKLMNFKTLLQAA
jgi:hypothetical protein